MMDLQLKSEQQLGSSMPELGIWLNSRDVSANVTSVLLMALKQKPLTRPLSILKRQKFLAQDRNVPSGDSCLIISRMVL